MIFRHKGARKSKQSTTSLALLAVIAVAIFGLAALIITGSLPQGLLGALVKLILWAAR